MALEQDEPAGRREETLEDGRPGVEILEPDERPATRVEQISSAVQHVRRVEDVGFDPAGGCADRASQLLGKPQHPRAVVDADDFLGPKIPQREGVPAGGALQVDRPPAPPVEIADQLELRWQQVCPTRPDQLDRLGQPAFVALGGLVPGKPGGSLHATRICAFRRARRANVRVGVGVGASFGVGIGAGGRVHRRRV